MIYDRQHDQHHQGPGRARHRRKPPGHDRDTWAQEGQKVMLMGMILMMMMMIVLHR